MNLARRNQTMLYRQLEIINQLEESESNPDTLAELFTLDHLATRVRRNAESLLVLSGEQPPRAWSQPVPMRDVLRAAIAETEDLDRVVFVADGQLAVGRDTVTDLTHLIAELTENAVRFSPPETTVYHPGRVRAGSSPAASCSPSRTGASACRRPSSPPRTPCWPSHRRWIWRCRRGWASTWWPGSRPGTASPCS